MIRLDLYRKSINIKLHLSLLLSKKYVIFGGCVLKLRRILFNEQNRIKNAFYSIKCHNFFFKFKLFFTWSKSFTNEG